ncbi:MAG: Txe/YoeB family addiction module toxin [Selenomonadaceae bacterium]|nr:Txe/YoeB family addiction module toxin [Selenomonadaceae bacterium]
MRRTFTEIGWEHYIYWENQDKKTSDKVKRLLKSIERDGAMKGEGKPERLKYGLGYSRRIDEANRLVYDIEGNDIVIKACRGHY